jgi:murein tripeptide amidase MpaA
VATRFRVIGLEDRRFNHAKLWNVLAPHIASETIRVEEIGRSLQGRSIRALHFGEGETKVLLWSQMHGDESTATMALADIVSFFAQGDGEPLRERLQRNLSITMVPMLNPDGAEDFTRRNAIGVDVNRDARRLATPEGRALKELRDRLEPDFGFNLHDQNALTLAGKNGGQVAMALLAPAADEAHSYGDVRTRARLVAATSLRSGAHDRRPHREI